MGFAMSELVLIGAASAAAFVTWIVFSLGLSPRSDE